MKMIGHQTLKPLQPLQMQIFHRYRLLLMVIIIFCYNMTVAQNEICEEREFIAFMKMRNSNVREKGNFQSTDKHHLEISKT